MDKEICTSPIDARSKSKKNRDEFFIILSYISLGIAFITAIVFGWWYFQPNNIIEVDPEPIIIKESFSIEQKEIIIPVEFCKNIKAEGLVQRRLISSSTVLILPEQKETLPPGCYDIDVRVVLPPQAVPDTYIIEYEATYKINPIKERTASFETTPFDIIE